MKNTRLPSWTTVTVYSVNLLTTFDPNPVKAVQSVQLNWKLRPGPYGHRSSWYDIVFILIKQDMFRRILSLIRGQPGICYENTK